MESEYQVLKCLETFWFMSSVNSVHSFQVATPRRVFNPKGAVRGGRPRLPNGCPLKASSLGGPTMCARHSRRTSAMGSFPSESSIRTASPISDDWTRYPASLVRDDYWLWRTNRALQDSLFLNFVHCSSPFVRIAIPNRVTKLVDSPARRELQVGVSHGYGDTIGGAAGIDFNRKKPWQP